MKIALIPIYNEEATLCEVLESAGRWADHLVLVDDGSLDASSRIARDWCVQNGAKGTFIALPWNQGMGAALKAGFVRIARGLEAGRWRPQDPCRTLRGKRRRAGVRRPARHGVRKTSSDERERGGTRGPVRRKMRDPGAQRC